MIRNFGLAVIFASITLPVLAAPHCDRPSAPQFDAGADATKEQIAALRGEVQTFLAASDAYQACLVKVGEEVTARSIEANQREKLRIGSRFNSLVGSYREAIARNSASGKLVSR